MFGDVWSSSSSFFSSLEIRFIVIPQFPCLLRVQRFYSLPPEPNLAPSFCDGAQMFLGGERLAVSFSFCGTPSKKQPNGLNGAGPVKSQRVCFAARASGYDEELVKTTICCF